MITYRKLTTGPGLSVLLEGRKVGEVIPITAGFGKLQGWHYKPKGAKPGETFLTVEAVKKSLEENN